MPEQPPIEFDQTAVSPVIGVILTVAITVILAAVVGVFVLGIGSSGQQGPSVGVTFEDGEIGGLDNVKMTVVSIERADKIEIKCDGAITTFTEINPSGSGAGNPPGDEPSVGRTVACGAGPGGISGGSTKMIVRATYNGKTEVIAIGP